MRTLLPALLIGLTGSPAVADVIHLKNGGQLEGRVLRDKSDDRFLVVDAKIGGEVRISRKRVERVEATDDAPVRTYAEVMKDFGDTAAEQYELALWCLQHGRRDEYETHLKRVVELDPDHAEARRRLGFKYHDGQWLTRDEIKETQGYVQDAGGRWVLPQQRDRMRREQDAKERRKELFKEVKLWQNWLHEEDAERRKQAVAGLAGIDDPLAVEPLLNILAGYGDSKSAIHEPPESPPTDRAVAVGTLAQIKADNAGRALARIAIEDPETLVRDAALAVLPEYRNPALVAEVARLLGDNDNVLVNRAGAVLGKIGDRTVVPTLIQALVTEHVYHKELNALEQAQALSGQTYRPVRTEVRGDGTVVRRRSVGVRNVGGGGMSFGGGGGGTTIGQSPSITSREVLNNRQVLDALNDITGANFGYDKVRWLQWVKDDARKRAAALID